MNAGPLVVGSVLMHAMTDPDFDGQAFVRRVREARRRAEADGRAAGHPQIDRRVRALSCIAVGRIDEDPTLVRAGLGNIERWTRQKNGYLPLCQPGWKALIEHRSWADLRDEPLAETDEG